jgi:hypothetical protein
MKKNLYVILWSLLLMTTHVQAQTEVGLDYYLPSNISYNPNTPTPKSVIGHEVGEWHVTHDKLVQYMYALAAASDRISIENRGSTFEGRPLLLLTITSPKNHNRLEELRSEHLALTGVSGQSLSTDNMPVVVYQGFSVHGNEPSGANAGLAYAYYLAAAQGPEIENKLDNMIILMDPSFNPDGLQRFAYWANTNRNMNLNPDPNDREYHEVWPGGRTNHYWFDVNRDWLPVQLPESQSRIGTFHNWMPNILTDHHEMGTNSSFFFQPGEPSRVHPLTPKQNQELTAEIGTYHAQALNKIGSLYYSEEDYDDYYYGKGSTFPDVNGSIGILFEQASSRGHVQESDNGVLTFPFTIRNQFTTALSTLEAGYGMRTKLLDYQRDFFKAMRNEKSKTAAYVFGDNKDGAKARHLAEILKRHAVEIHRLQSDQIVNGVSYSKDNSYVVPLNQKNPRLIRSMFETRTSFSDSLFYDISAWTFPMAFDLNIAETTSLPNVGPAIPELPEVGGSVSQQSAYAYLFEWHEYYTPKVLNSILQSGLRAKVAREPFRQGGRLFDYGTIMIPVQNQSKTPAEIYALLQYTVANSGVDIVATETGITDGIDLGSREFEAVKPIQVAMLVGNGIPSYEAGEIWHLLDTRYQIKLTKIDTDYLAQADLSRYTDIIIPGLWGSSGISDRAAKNLSNWVNDGGTLIGYQQAANWFKNNELMSIKMRRDSTLRARNIRFDQKADFLGAQVTGGAIFEAKLDRSHPIGWGYTHDKIALFRDSNIYLEPEKNSYDNPLQYTSNPLLSGYISEENASLISSSVPFKVSRKGKGRVILFTDNTNFRAFWYGTNKLLMNAIFFGHIM